MREILRDLNKWKDRMFKKKRTKELFGERKIMEKNFRWQIKMKVKILGDKCFFIVLSSNWDVVSLYHIK